MKETQQQNGAKNRLRHGFKRRDNKHPLYTVWNGIKRRCYDPDQPCYSNYGGRGITMCDAWLDVKSFIEWGICNGWSHGLQLDRKDNDGNYEPSNCHFVTPSQNARNTRSNRYITIDGVTKTMVEWCEIYDRSYRAVNGRINMHHMDPVEAIKKPTKRRFNGSGKPGL